MTKEEFKDSISLYIDGDLSLNKVAEFEDLLQNDRILKSYFDEVKSLINNIENIENVKASKDFMSSLDKRISEYNRNEDRATDINVANSDNFSWLKIFGFNPVPVFGMAAAIVLSFQIYSSFGSKDLPSLSTDQEIEINIFDRDIEDDIAFSDSLSNAGDKPEERKINNMSTQKASFGNKKITN